MLIRFMGPGVRIIPPYTWLGGDAVDVDPATAAELLTLPDEVFVIADEEPMGRAKAEEVALAAVARSVPGRDEDKTGHSEDRIGRRKRAERAQG